jgi:hypothetical protein
MTPITYVDKSGTLCVDVAKFMRTKSFKRALASTKQLADRLGLHEVPKEKNP